MAEEKITLSKRDRLAVAWRSTFIQGSWNYERMQMVVGLSNDPCSNQKIIQNERRAHSSS